MAQLTQPQSSGFQVDELPPAGTFCGVILDIIDLFQVQRPKFENPSEKETLDVTRFLFGYQAQDGRFYKIQTREMRISGNSKSKLFQFLTGLLGHPPKYGWDYCELRGRPAMITVMHQQGRKDPTKTYAGIASVAPLPHQLQGAVPPVAAFNYVRDPQVSSGAPNPTQHQAPPRPQNPAHPPHPALHQPAPTQHQPAPTQHQPAPYQYPMHMPHGHHAPQNPAAAPSSPAPVTSQPTSQGNSPTQQPPTALWNPETDDPEEIPF